MSAFLLYLYQVMLSLLSLLSSLIHQTRIILIHCVFSAVRYSIPSRFSIMTPQIHLQSYDLLCVAGYSFVIIIAFVTPLSSLIIVGINCCPDQSYPSLHIVSHWMAAFLLHARFKRYVFMTGAYYRRFCFLSTVFYNYVEQWRLSLSLTHTNDYPVLTSS